LHVRAAALSAGSSASALAQGVVMDPESEPSVGGRDGCPCVPQCTEVRRPRTRCRRAALAGPCASRVLTDRIPPASGTWPTACRTPRSRCRGWRRSSAGTRASMSGSWQGRASLRRHAARARAIRVRAAPGWRWPLRSG